MAQLGPLPPSALPWTDSDGRPTQAFLQYVNVLDQLFRLMTAGNAGLVNAVSDAAAAAAGVKINQLYRNGNAVQIRLT